MKEQHEGRQRQRGTRFVGKLGDQSKQKRRYVEAKYEEQQQQKKKKMLSAAAGRLGAPTHRFLIQGARAPWFLAPTAPFVLPQPINFPLVCRLLRSCFLLLLLLPLSSARAGEPTGGRVVVPVAWQNKSKEEERKNERTKERRKKKKERRKEGRKEGKKRRKGKKEERVNDMTSRGLDRCGSAAGRTTHLGSAGTR